MIKTQVKAQVKAQVKTQLNLKTVGTKSESLTLNKSKCYKYEHAAHKPQKRKVVASEEKIYQLNNTLQIPQYLRITTTRRP